MFWMRSVFQEDAAKATLEYLLYGIKKPRPVAPRIVVRRMKQLSGYIDYLPPITAPKPRVRLLGRRG